MAIADIISPDDFMPATLQRRAFDREGWVFEHKLDGFRALVRRTSAGVDVLSRSSRSLAVAFPEVARAAAALPTGVVLDAELIVLGEHGFGSFEDTRRRVVMKRPTSIIEAANEQPAVLCVFDCLVLRGRDIRARPLLERKAAIAPHLAYLPGVQVVSFIGKHGVAAFAAAVEFGTEGIVAKRADSPYKPGRSADWSKIKNPDFYRPAALGIRE